MAVSAIPAIIDALVTQARAALQAPEATPTVTVYDSFGNSDDPGDFLMIGVDDPDSEVAATTADSEQEWAGVGHVERSESGSIACAALSWNGNGDVKAARDAVFAMTSTLEGFMRTDPSLGLGNTIWTEFGKNLELTQPSNENGVAALLVFRITFTASRI